MSILWPEVYDECPYCESDEHGRSIYQCENCGRKGCYKVDSGIFVDGCVGRATCPSCKQAADWEYLGKIINESEEEIKEEEPHLKDDNSIETTAKEDDNERDDSDTNGDEDYSDDDSSSSAEDYSKDDSNFSTSSGNINKIHNNYSQNTLSDSEVLDHLYNFSWLLFFISIVPLCRLTYLKIKQQNHIVNYGFFDYLELLLEIVVFGLMLGALIAFTAFVSYKTTGGLENKYRRNVCGVILILSVILGFIWFIWMVGLNL